MASTDIGRMHPDLTEAYHIVCFRGLDGQRMPLAPLCRSLPRFARCAGECVAPSMPLQAIKSERDWYVEAVDLQSRRLLSDIKEGSYDRSPNFYTRSTAPPADNRQIKKM